MSRVYEHRFNLQVYGKNQPVKEPIDSESVSLCIIGENDCTLPESITGPIDNWGNYLSQQKLNFTMFYKEHHISNVCLTNFDLIRTITTCEFGRIVLAVLKSNEKAYAIKVMEREKVVKSKQVEQVIHIKSVLHSIRFPFIIFSEFSFKDNNYLYLVMPYIQGPNLFCALKEIKQFSENDARFYFGQVVLAIEYLHNLNILNRSIKLENLLLDEYGYIKLIGFEHSKILSYNSRTFSICGIDDYIAPEIVLRMGHHLPADWWSAGVLLYELCSGHSPFYTCKDISTKFSNICNGKYHMNLAFSLQLKELCNKLLQTNLSKRLGNLIGGVNDIKNHIWFENYDFLRLVNRNINPPRLNIKVQKYFINEEKVLLSSQELFAKEFINF